MLYYLSLVLALVVAGRGIQPLQIPGYVDDSNSLIAAHQEKQFETLGALVVEWRLPPVFNDQLGDQDRDLAVGMLSGCSCSTWRMCSTKGNRTKR